MVTTILFPPPCTSMIFHTMSNYFAYLFLSSLSGTFIVTGCYGTMQCSIGRLDLRSCCCPVGQVKHGSHAASLLTSHQALFLFRWEDVCQWYTNKGKEHGQEYSETSTWACQPCCSPAFYRSQHARAIAAIADCVAKEGTLLIICHGREPDEPTDGPLGTYAQRTGSLPSIWPSGSPFSGSGERRSTPLPCGREKITRSSRKYGKIEKTFFINTIASK